MSKRSIKDIHKLQQKAHELSEKGRTQLQIAKQLGVSTRTLRRWQHKPKKIEEVLQADAAKVKVLPLPLPTKLKLQKDEAPYTQQIDDLLQLSLDTLNEVLTNLDIAPRERLNACKIVKELKRDLMIEGNSTIFVERGGLSDIQLIQEVLREILVKSNTQKAIQAAATLLKASQMQVESPKEIDYSSTELKSLSDEELDKLYTDVLGNGRL